VMHSACPHFGSGGWVASFWAISPFFGPACTDFVVGDVLVGGEPRNRRFHYRRTRLGSSGN
jgi:hypothetical protein